MQHAGFLKNDAALADFQLVAALDGHHGPVLGIEIALQGLEAQGGAEDFFGLAAFHDLGQGTGVIQLQMIADDIVDFFRLHDLAQAAEQGSGAAGGAGVHEDVLFIPDHIGIVGRAFRGAGVAVKVAMVVIDAADPVDVFFQFKGLHGNSVDSD